jgi:hypothetical protein
MKLFHYQPINKNTLQNLILQKVWASDPKTFNDPFEFIMRENFHVTAKGMVEYLTKEEIAILSEFKRRASSFGVVAYSKKGGNILLWSHYALHHTGMCLEFEIDENKVGNLFEVEYVSHIPADVENIESYFSKYLISKGKDWEYEQEYRQIFESGTGYFDYPGPLTRISFGCRTARKDIQAIMKICDAQIKSDIEFSKFSIQPNTFFLTQNTVIRRKGDDAPNFW